MISQNQQTAGTPADAGAGQFVPLDHATHDDAESQSASILADMAGVTEAPPPPPPGRRIRLSSQLILMATVLVLSAAALYIMRRMGTGAGMSFVAMPLDYSLEQTPPDRLADHQRILEQLETTDIAIQIPPEDIEKNPFHLITREAEVDLESLDPEDRDRMAARMERERAERRQQEIDRALGSITVHSILTGSRPIANINDQLVSIGDTVADVLEVVEINDRSVVVEADGQRFTVRMQEKAEPRRRRPRRPRR